MEIVVVEVERIIVVKVVAIRCNQGGGDRHFEVAAIEVIKMTLIFV